MKNERMHWIDILKGIGIVCIVFSHVLQNTGALAKVLYAFHVPLFFFVTGFLYRDGEASLTSVLKKKTIRIIVPYLLWGSISLVIFLFLGQYAESILESGRSATFGSGMYSLLVGYSDGNSPLWFLPAIFLTAIFMWGYVHAYPILEKNIGISIASVLPVFLSIMLGCVFQTNGVNSAFWSIDDVVILFGFTWCGYLMKKKEIAPTQLGVGIVLLSVGSVMALFANGRVSYLVGTYHNLIVFYAIAALLIAGVASVSHHIGQCNLLEYVGRNTMPILLMHKFPVLFFQCVCPYIKDRWIERSMPYMILITFLAIVMSCVVGEIIRRILPMMIGENAKRKGSTMCR